MNTLEKRLQSWKSFDDAQRADMERRALLMKTVPAHVLNPPTLYEPTRVKILRPFTFNKKVLAVGTVVQLPKCLALSMIGARKAERVE